MAGRRSRLLCWEAGGPRRCVGMLLVAHDGPLVAGSPTSAQRKLQRAFSFL